MQQTSFNWTMENQGQFIYKNFFFKFDFKVINLQEKCQNC